MSPPAPENRRRFIGPALILLAAALATAPILLHGSFCGDDFEFHVISWFDVQQNWLHGTLFPHWMTTANYGAGEPRYIFYPPLIRMLGAALGFAMPWQLVPILLIFLLLAGTGLATRALALEVLPDAPATLAGCAALFSGFALFAAYERTAFAELTGGFWIPLLLRAALRDRNPSAGLWRRALDGSTLPMALLFAGAWLSNGPVGVMASYLIAAVALVASLLCRCWAPLLRASIAAGLGIALPALYLIPAAWEQRWTDLRAAIDYPVFNIENNWIFSHHDEPVFAPFVMVLDRASFLAVSMIAVALLGLLVSVLHAQNVRPGELGRKGPLGAEGATEKLGSSVENGGKSPSVAKAGNHSVGVMRGLKPPPPSEVSSSAVSKARFGFVSLLRELKPPASSENWRWWIPLALIPAAVLFLQFPVSLPIWNVLPKLRFLQYPWRWVLVVEAPMAIFFAGAVWPARPVRRWLRVAVPLVCALVFLTATAFAARTFLRVCVEGDTVADMLEMYQHGGGLEGTDEYEPPDADHWKIATNLPDACLAADPNTTLGIVGLGESIPTWRPGQGSCEATATAQLRQPEHLRIDTIAAKPGYLILRLVRYPAWRITVNGKAAGSVPPRDDGLIVVPVPQGPVELKVDWRTTPDVVVGRGLSCLAVLLLIGLGLLERKRAGPQL